MDAFFSKNFFANSSGLTILGATYVPSTKSVMLVDPVNNFANDAAAATGGIPVGGLYHTTGAVKVRLV